MAQPKNNLVVIYGKNKDAALMEELKAENLGERKQVQLANPSKIREDDYALEENVVNADEVIIIGKPNDHECFARIAKLHKKQGPEGVKIKHVESPALKEANKKAQMRNGGGNAAQAKPNADWTVPKIEAWLTLNDIDFKANTKKEELLELVP